MANENYKEQISQPIAGDEILIQCRYTRDGSFKEWFVTMDEVDLFFKGNSLEKHLGCGTSFSTKDDMEAYQRVSNYIKRVLYPPERKFKFIKTNEKEEEIRKFVEQLHKRRPSGNFSDKEELVLKRKIIELVPEIKKERLEALALHIKPVLRYLRDLETDELIRSENGRLLFYSKTKINPHDWKFQSNFKPGKLAKGLKPFEEIGTYHEYAASAMCRASIADVIAQLPGNLIERVAAFEINHLPLEKYKESCPLGTLPINWGFHYARTRLYER